MQVKCKVFSLNKSRVGTMFTPSADYTFADLILWVYKNCAGAQKIEIDLTNGEISAIYDERYEIYSLDKTV